MVDKKAKILDSGKELFSTQGFKDTNVADITKKAGIATGTFYLYYPSKEELFMEIYLEENEKLKRAIMETVDPDGDPLTVLMELMQKNMQGMAANPILREWYNKDIFNKIEEKFRQQNGLEQVDFLYQSFIEIIQKWQADGKMRRDIDSEMIMALFSVVIIVDLHKDEIGFQYFPKIQEYLTEFIMNGLRDSSTQATAGGRTKG
jgi:AcrR family transcriptional regulator